MTASPPSSERHAETPEQRIRACVLDTAQLPEAIAVDDAIATVLGRLAERLTKGQANALLAGLPPALRAMLEHRVPAVRRSATKLERPAFVARVAEHLGVTPAHAERVCEAVFAAVRRELSDGLVCDVAHQLPRGLVFLWLAGPPRAAPKTASAYAARRRVEKAIEAVGPLPSGITSEDIYAAVVCAFAERLSGGAARALLLGLPDTLRAPVVRPLLHRGETAFLRDREGLFRLMEEHLHIDASRAERFVRAALCAVRGVLPAKTVGDITSQLPADLRELWQQA